MAVGWVTGTTWEQLKRLLFVRVIKNPLASLLYKSITNVHLSFTVI